MSIPCKFERSVLSYDEHEIVLRSHHPGIYDAGLDDLKALRQRLRDMRDKERTLAREKRRQARGKETPRGGSVAGTAEHPLRRKQVFAAVVETRQQGDRSHAQAGSAGRSRRSGTSRSRHASCGSVSRASAERRHSQRGHACAAKSTAADTSSSSKDRKRVTSDKECTSRSRRPQLKKHQ